MKRWEKIQKLDQEYVEARKALVLGQAFSVTVKVEPMPAPANNSVTTKNALKRTATTDSH